MGGGGECGLSYISCEKSDINSCNSHVFSLKEQILALEEKLFDLLHHAILPPKVWHGAGGGGQDYAWLPCSRTCKSSAEDVIKPTTIASPHASSKVSDVLFRSSVECMAAASGCNPATFPSPWVWTEGGNKLLAATLFCCLSFRNVPNEPTMAASACVTSSWCPFNGC